MSDDGGDDGGDVGGDFGSDGGQTPWLYKFPRISHYYGDTVRQIFLAEAGLMLLGAPFFADNLRAELPFEIIGSIILVSVAAVTNPWKRSVVMLDSVLSGTGLLIFELWALSEYGQVSMLAFSLRQAIAIGFMFAFYFSMKTLRAMTMHQVGKSDTSYEFHRLQHESESQEQREAEDEAERRRRRREQIEQTIEEYQ